MYSIYYINYYGNVDLEGINEGKKIRRVDSPERLPTFPNAGAIGLGVAIKEAESVIIFLISTTHGGSNKCSL